MATSAVPVRALFILFAALLRWGTVASEEKCDDPKYAGMTPTHTMCLPVDPSSEEVVLTQEDKDAIVNRHNELRASVNPAATNMQKMVWDEKLARVAAKWTRHCTSGHDENRKEPDYPHVFINQNSAQGHKNFITAINKWYGEVSMYTYGQDYLGKFGHFIQVVFAETGRIGCGESKCPNSPFKVYRACNYAVGLDSGGPPYESGMACGKCPNYCSGNLCDCGGKLCYNRGVVNVTTCECHCSRGRKGESCEKRDCSREPYHWCTWMKPSDCATDRNLKVAPEACHILCGLCPAPIDENGSCGNRKDGCKYESPLCMKPKSSDPDSACVCTKEANRGDKVECLPPPDPRQRHRVPLKVGASCENWKDGCESAGPACMKLSASEPDSMCMCTQPFKQEGRVQCAMGNSMPTVPFALSQFLLVSLLGAVLNIFALP